MSVTDLDLRRLEQKLDAVLELLREKEWGELSSGKYALSLSAAANALSVSLTTMKRHVRVGKVRTVKIGDRTLVPRSEVERLATPKQAPARRPKKQPVDWRVQGDEIRKRLKARR